VRPEIKQLAVSDLASGASAGDQRPRRRRPADAADAAADATLLTSTPSRSVHDVLQLRRK